MNYFFGVPGKPVPELELTYNFGVDSYELGTAYGHIALTVEDMTETLEKLAAQGIEPERRAVLGARGRLAALLRPRPRRLPDRADRAQRLLSAGQLRTAELDLGRQLGRLHGLELAAACGRRSRRRR